MEREQSVPSRRDRLLGGLWGALVGDALGVPVEFRPRATLEREPVTDLREYGTHSQPRGTWSDDSSLLLCTVESLLDGFDTADLGRRFVRWYQQGHWTPWGQVFDVGVTTREAIDNLARGVPAEQAGPGYERSAGNGSLMRILPLALHSASAPPAELLDRVHRASSVTHGHPRAQMASGIHCLVAGALLDGADARTAYARAIAQAREYYADSPYAADLPHFARVLGGEVQRLPRAEIQTSGYAVHTLEASLWCLLNAGSFREAVLAAVNLGDDTDTTGTVTGGLAGLHWGLAAIPADWRDALARRDDVAALFERFVAVIEGTT